MKGDHLLVARTHPDVAARTNHGPKDVAGLFQREALPVRKVRVSRLSRTVPHADDGGLILILERSDCCSRVIQGGTWCGTRGAPRLCRGAERGCGEVSAAAERHGF